MVVGSFLLHWGEGRRWLAASLLALALAAGCQPAAPPPPVAPHPVALRARFFALLYAGDSIYAQKTGYGTFARALTYYNRAQTLADRSQDTALLAEAVFAKGRVYDAWNKEPQKTIQYFQQATALFRRLPDPHSRIRYFYAKHLVAHAYDKVPDSLRAVQVLRQLRRELAGAPDTLLRRLPFTVEMALIATEVRNYALADTLLRQLTRRAWIRNDPDTYDYLHHYYLAQARLDVYLRRHPAAPYLDSLQAAARRAANVMDRQYYAHNLARLSVAAGRPRAGYDYLMQATRLRDSIDNNGDASTLRRALVESETQASARQRHYEAAARIARARTVVLLSGALTIISLLSFYLARQSHHARKSARHLAQTNHVLDEKVAQVELLNKEIQHRVKNNLHMIFSLLQMQERRTDNEEVIEQLQAARLRVESIAALHNQLLGNPSKLDLADFLKQLISAVVDCLANDRKVVTHIQTEALHLPVNSYFALSLILNEWVTNSIKYARPWPATDAIELNVAVQNRSGEVRIAYSDNGQPTEAPAHSARMPSGLGTQIVVLLTRQLGATLHTAPDAPFHYELRIPAPAA